MKGANQFEGPDRFSAVCMFFIVETLFGRPDSPAGRHDYTSESETRACTHTHVHAVRPHLIVQIQMYIGNKKHTHYAKSPDVVVLAYP